VSNFLAVATVSAALQRLLTPRISAAVGGAEVWVDRSDVKRQKSGVNIYMYRTSLDSVWRNEDLPGRTSDGTIQPWYGRIEGCTCTSFSTTTC